MTNIVDVNPEEFYIGMPVEVVFEDTTNEITLPKFRKSSQLCAVIPSYAA